MQENLLNINHQEMYNVEIAPMFYSCTVTKKSELMREKNATPGLYVWEDDLGVLNAVSTDQQVSVFDMEGASDD